MHFPRNHSNEVTDMKSWERMKKERETLSSDLDCSKISRAEGWNMVRAGKRGLIESVIFARVPLMRIYLVI